MMLKIVVFPAPLGPITPTISHSPARKVTSWAAWTPPKRMEHPLTSSTDVAHSHLGHAGVLEAEPLAGEPALDGLDLLADAAGMVGQREEQQQGTDDDGGVLLREGLEQGNGVDRLLQVELVEE